ncbi:MAG: sugar transferase [Opitutaceae bacterium]|jgi:lipopolysaccharide/colanic/teichoic acid biosynthesis glycosyltransferase
MLNSICIPFARASSKAGIKAMPAWKRTVDISFCLLAMPVLGLGLLLMTVFTGLVSPGPVFFRQERIGFRGRRFKILKFRTMKVGADTGIHQKYFKQLMDSNAPMAKLDGRRDGRLIPGGWILRASGLDELPQLINVLCGDMSLVGPRPCLPSEFELYLPAQRERFDATPGLTGLWQVSGKNRTTFEEMIRLDVHYARHASLPVDLKIILLTPWALGLQILETCLQKLRTVRPARRLKPVPSSPPARTS